MGRRGIRRNPLNPKCGWCLFNIAHCTCRPTETVAKTDTKRRRRGQHKAPDDLPEFTTDDVEFD